MWVRHSRSGLYKKSICSLTKRPIKAVMYHCGYDSISGGIRKGRKGGGEGVAKGALAPHNGREKVLSPPCKYKLCLLFLIQASSG